MPYRISQLLSYSNKITEARAAPCVSVRIFRTAFLSFPSPFLSFPSCLGPVTQKFTRSRQSAEGRLLVNQGFMRLEKFLLFNSRK